jgi:hypothetical protein
VAPVVCTTVLSRFCDSLPGLFFRFHDLVGERPDQAFADYPPMGFVYICKRLLTGTIDYLHQDSVKIVSSSFYCPSIA